MDPTDSSGNEPHDSESSFQTTYRRNGKPFSCEPCRRGKLKCGHELPTCSRCLRRGKARDCIYHPAPMTKSRTSPRASPIQKPVHAGHRSSLPPTVRSATAPQLQSFVQPALPPPLPALDPATQHYQPILPPPPVAMQDPPIYNAQSRFGSASSFPLFAARTPSSGDSQFKTSAARSRRSVHSQPTVENMKDRTGFLGSSAFSAIFTENQRSLGIEDEEPERSDSPSPVSPEKIHQGAEVLTLLRDMTIFSSMFGTWFDISDGVTMIKPMYKCWIDGIVESFGDVLANHRTVQDLYPLSELIWRNTQHSVPMDGSTTTLGWGRLHTGQNLRWETVGALCSFLGLITVLLSDWDPIFNRTKVIAKDRHELIEKVDLAMEQCLSFCRECESITELYLCALFESVIVLESVRGEAHFRAWDRMGEVINVAVHLGLHQELHQDAKTPFIVHETRIRVFDMLYGHDKSLSTFLGRPPRLSYRYSVMQLPLDLSDEEMILEGEDLQRALGGLDNGWNTQGMFHRSTWRRVWAGHAQIREDILEIALGTSTDNLAERGQRIREKIVLVDEKLPSFFKVDVLEVLANCQSAHHPLIAGWERGRVPNNCLHLVSIKCGMLHTRLLLEKALINRLKSGTTEALVSHAKLLLKYVLAAVAKRDFLSAFSIDVTFLIAFHGITAAGIVAVEMLKQENNQQYPEVLPRSETIQDLSVFISALAAIEPNVSGVGNYAICNKARKILKKVMDKILSPKMASANNNISSALTTPSTFDDPNMYLGQHSDADFLDWLENIEWERGSLFNT